MNLEPFALHALPKLLFLSHTGLLHLSSGPVRRANCVSVTNSLKIPLKHVDEQLFTYSEEYHPLCCTDRETKSADKWSDVTSAIV